MEELELVICEEEKVQIVEVLERAAGALGMEVLVVGSLRRGQEGSHDFDVCARKPGVDEIFRPVDKSNDARASVGYRSLVDDLLELLQAENLPSGECFLVVARLFH